MRQSLRIQKKVLAYSYLCKLLGIINEKEFQRITAKSSSNNRPL
jgi:hypothetical protein